MVYEPLPGFAWSVTQAFEDALLEHSLAPGDVIHERLPDGGALLQIRTCAGKTSRDEAESTTEAHSTGETIEPDADADEKTARAIDKRRDARWQSAVEIDFYDFLGAKPKVIATTQGRLYEFLRKGDIAVLSGDTPHPSRPMLKQDLRRQFSRFEHQFRLWLHDVSPAWNAAFVTPTRPGDSGDVGLAKRLEKSLGEVEFTRLDARLGDIGIPSSVFFPDTRVLGFATPSGKVEAFRDAIKSALWPRDGLVPAPRDLSRVFIDRNHRNVAQFSLANYGAFLDARNLREQADDSLRCVSMVHALPFRYRYGSPNSISRMRSDLASLANFIDAQRYECPNHLFRENGPSPSGCKVELGIPLARSWDHPIVQLARRCAEAPRRQKAAHENLQVYFLENDPSFVAAELSVWIQPGELSNYVEVFGTRAPITGHIDLLRYERKERRIEVWDYKPRAGDERFAATQVFLYALMLAVRLGRPMSSIGCGYFDEAQAFTFEPSQLPSEVLAKARGLFS
jgi:hypothetical protein